MPQVFQSPPTACTLLAQIPTLTEEEIIVQIDRFADAQGRSGLHNILKTLEDLICDVYVIQDSSRPEEAHDATDDWADRSTETEPHDVMHDLADRSTETELQINQIANEIIEKNR